MAVGVLYFLLISFVGLTRHWGYLTSANDSGVFDQSLWGILNGTPFLVSVLGFDLPINQLGLHFNPILAAFAPLYAVYPAAEWLILIQALAISIAAWPVYVVGIKILLWGRFSTHTPPMRLYVIRPNGTISALN